MPWPALAAAQAREQRSRVEFHLTGRCVGSVARAHLPLLAREAPFARQHADALHIEHADDDAFAALHARLRAAGAVRAWRDEIFPLFDPATLAPLARIERAATRFWGTLTLGAHATGFVRGADGRPHELWIARRSPHKATDPAKLDNLVGGGVGAGQAPHEALVREAFEEAGLAPHELGPIAAASVRNVLQLERDIPEGYQREWLYAFDIELPPGREPRNQDGEVAEFLRLPVAQARRLVEATDELTVDAALVTIDFLQRHGFIGDEALARRLRALQVRPPEAALSGNAAVNGAA